ncbi:MAG: glycosyltransferase family 39 protein [Mycobacteriales bacterium]
MTAVERAAEATARRPRAVRRASLPAAVVVCALARLWYLGGPAAQFNADEATTGLMVREILGGRHFTFYAGQHYGGTLEQYLQAAVYLLVPMPSTAWTLRLPLVALSMLTCALVHLLADRVLGSPVRAGLAALLYAVSPWFNVVGSVTSLGFYVAGQTLSVAALYAALRAGADRRTGGWLAGAGLAAGLAVWTSLTSLYVLLPVAWWLLPVLGRDVRRWGAAAGGFVVGALPVLAWVGWHRTLPLPPEPAEASSVVDRLGNLAEPVLREYVGVAYPHGDGGLPLPVQIGVVVLLVAAYAVALLRRRGLRDFLLLRVSRRRPGDLLLAVPPVVAACYAVSDSTWYTGTPRYLLVTYPLLAVGLAALVPLGSPTRRAATALVVVLSAVLTAGFFRDQVRSQPSTRNRDAVLRQVTDRLVAEGETRVRAGYWTAMPLQYVAGDRLVVAVCGGVARFPAAQAEVAAAPAPVYVGSDHDGTDDRIPAALTARGITFRSTRVGFLTVYDRLSVAAGPADLCL